MMDPRYAKTRNKDMAKRAAKLKAQLAKLNAMQQRGKK